MFSATAIGAYHFSAFYPWRPLRRPSLSSSIHPLLFSKSPRYPLGSALIYISLWDLRVDPRAWCWRAIISYHITSYHITSCTLPPRPTDLATTRMKPARLLPTRVSFFILLWAVGMTSLFFFSHYARGNSMRRWRIPKKSIRVLDYITCIYPGREVEKRPFEPNETGRQTFGIPSR